MEMINISLVVKKKYLKTYMNFNHMHFEEDGIILSNRFFNRFLYSFGKKKNYLRKKCFSPDVSWIMKVLRFCNCCNISKKIDKSLFLSLRIGNNRRRFTLQMITDQDVVCNRKCQSYYDQSDIVTKKIIIEVESVKLRYSEVKRFTLWKN